MKGSSNVGGAFTGKLQFRIDLRKGENRNVLADGLHSIDVPLLNGDGGQNPPGAYAGVKGIYDLFDSGADGTQLTATAYASQTGGDKLAIKGGDVLTFGVEAGLKSEDRKIIGGTYYSPGSGFVKWNACGQ